MCTIGWQNSNPLSHPNATLAPQARQARASGENLNYLLSLSLISWYVSRETDEYKINDPVSIKNYKNGH